MAIVLFALIGVGIGICFLLVALAIARHQEKVCPDCTHFFACRKCKPACEKEHKNSGD